MAVEIVCMWDKMEDRWKPDSKKNNYVFKRSCSRASNYAEHLIVFQSCTVAILYKGIQGNALGLDCRAGGGGIHKYNI